jgi:hypothetical protein
MGRGEKIPLDTRYEVIGGDKNWKLVKEIGMHARTAMRSDGILCFISVRERKDGKWNYVIGKTSPFIGTFNLYDMYKKLNTIEKLSTDLWGGSDIIGGSPRVNGSTISPERMEKIINEIISQSNN